jgi:hypothetical protein
MSKFEQSDGLNIVERYTCVVTVAIAYSSLPVKDAANEQAKNDQVRVASCEYRGAERGDVVGHKVDQNLVRARDAFPTDVENSVNE